MLVSEGYLITSKQHGEKTWGKKVCENTNSLLNLIFFNLSFILKHIYLHETAQLNIPDIKGIHWQRGSAVTTL